MIKSLIAFQGKNSILIGITRKEFEGMIGAGTIAIRFSEIVKELGATNIDSIYLIGGESDAAIEAELKKKMKPLPEG